MKDKIQELIKQSTTVEEHKWGVSYDKFDKEKFAELILEECCLKLLDMDEKAKGNHNYYKHAALQLKQHFRGDGIL